MFLLTAISSAGQHFTLSKVLFDNVAFDSPQAVSIYTSNLNLKSENIDAVIEALQNNFTESQNTANNETALNILNGYSELQHNQYYAALKYYVINEKRNPNNLKTKNSLANKILLALIYEKQGAISLAYSALKNVRSSDVVENYEVLSYLAYLKAKTENHMEAYVEFHSILSDAKKTSPIDYYFNLYNTSKSAIEIGKYKEALQYAKQADSVIQNSGSYLVNSKINYTYNNLNEPSNVAKLKNQSLINLSVAYRKVGSYNESITTLNKLIENEKKNSNSEILPDLYVNKALTYTLMKDYNNASYTYYEAQKIYLAKNDKGKSAEVYNLMAKNSYLSGELGQTVSLCENAIDVSKKNSDYKNLSASYFILSETYAANNDFANSQKYFKLYNETKDIYDKNIQQQTNAFNLKNNNTQLLTQQIESEVVEDEKQSLELINTRMLAEQKEQELLLLKKETELKEKDFLNQKLEKDQIQRNLALIKEQLEKEQLQKNYIKINREREIKILENQNNQNQITLLNTQKSIAEKENELKSLELNENKSKQKIYATGFILLSLFILALGYFLFKMRKQNQIIERNNRTIQDTNLRLETTITQISEQKKVIENKNVVIEDSINYAQRIQESLLMPESMFAQNFKDAFIISLPKEKVSGDFYLLQQFNHKLYLAVVDCTGHGVPGAMIAALAYQELVHLINTPHYSIGSVLDDLNNRINSLVNSHNQIGSDGMDLTLLCINTKTKNIKYAGAKSSFILYDGNEIKELKTDKKSIGHVNDNTDFFKYAVNELSYKTGDQLFLYTDGYADQFSEIENKRIGSRNFKLKINEAITKSSVEQKRLFINYLKEHQQNRIQTDDITLIGITLS